VIAATAAIAGEEKKEEKARKKRSGADTGKREAGRHRVLRKR
jgi:hypothetical protein